VQEEGPRIRPRRRARIRLHEREWKFSQPGQLEAEGVQQDPGESKAKKDPHPRYTPYACHSPYIEEGQHRRRLEAARPQFREVDIGRLLQLDAGEQEVGGGWIGRCDRGTHLHPRCTLPY